MTQLARLSPTLPIPALVAAADTHAQRQFLEFFAAAIRNPNTRKAYMRACSEFLAWCDTRQVRALVDIEPLHVAAWIEQLGQTVSAPTVKQKLAGIRHLFDWLVTGHVLYVNPAASVRGPAHSVRRGKTPALAPDEARQLLDSIDLATEAGLRDRALIALMVYSFARIGAAVKMRVEDVYTQQHRLWVRLHEKGGKRHEMPCHHTLEAYLRGYIETAGLAATPKAPLFSTIDRKTKHRSGKPMNADMAFQAVRRRATAAGIATAIGNHSFRVTGITAYLKNGGTLERAAAMANHASTRTTQLYDRRNDDVSLNEIERVLI